MKDDTPTSVGQLLLIDTDTYQRFANFCALFDAVCQPENKKPCSANPAPEIVIIDNDTGKIMKG